MAAPIKIKNQDGPVFFPFDGNVAFAGGFAVVSNSLIVAWRFQFHVLSRFIFAGTVGRGFSHGLRQTKVPHAHGESNHVALAHFKKHRFGMLVVVLAAQVDFHFARGNPFQFSRYKASSEDCAKAGLPALFSENEFPTDKASREMATDFAPAQSNYAPALR